MKSFSFKHVQSYRRLHWLFYATGFLGLFLINSALASIIFYRYDPGPNAEQLPLLVPTVLVGAAFFFGRLIGAILQPVVGHISDHTRGRWGRRRPFLALSTLPMVGSFILLFNPFITETSRGNSFYLIGLLCIFYLSFSLYQVPYLAWLPELASQDHQRVVLSSWLAIFSLVGTVLGGAGTPWLSANYGFAIMTLIIGLISGGALLLPLLAPEQATKQTQRMSLTFVLKSSWQNASFRPYVLGISSAWVSMAILSVCPPFFAIALFHQDIGFGGLVTVLIMGGAALGIGGVKPLVMRVGKKRAFQFAMLWSGIGMLLMAVVPIWLGKSFLPLYIILLPVGSLGLGGFFVLPNIMMPDVVDRDPRVGKSAQAVYFGSRGLFVELSMGVGILISGLLLSLGKTAAQPFGVQLSLVAGGVFAFASASLLTAYPVAK